MQKMKRILAMAGVIIILGLYIVTLILSFSDSPKASEWLFISIGATVVIPTLLYAYIRIYKLLNKKDEK